jgi:hypothetical protein
MTQKQAGKGSKRRPTNQQAFDKGYKGVQWGMPAKKTKEKKR